jgi:hypothetical protein
MKGEVVWVKIAGRVWTSVFKDFVETFLDGG